MTEFTPGPSPSLAWAKKARTEFCQGTPFTSPFEVVEAGLRTLEDWTETLDKFRNPPRSGIKPIRTPNGGEVISMRQRILNVLAAEEFLLVGATIREVAIRAERTIHWIYPCINELVEERLVKKAKATPESGYRKNVVLYQLAGAGEGTQ